MLRSRALSSETGGSHRTHIPTLRCRGETGSGEVRGHRRDVSSAERGEGDTARVQGLVCTASMPSGTNSRSDGVSVELGRRSGTYWIQMVRCAGVSSTVSPVRLSETVESPQGLPAIADLAKPVEAAGVEISKEDRDVRVQKAPAESSELESD